jgi:hypothetical protein
MRRQWARLTVMGIVVLSALALSAPLAFAGSRVPPNLTQIGPLQVRVYSLMCDGHGKPLHTRLNVKNTSSTPQTVTVMDEFARKIVYDPPGPIAPGFGTLVHITSARETPAHNATIVAEGATGTVPIPKSPCNSTGPPTTDPTNPPTTDPTVPPTGATVPTIPPTVPQNPGGGPPVGSPGVVGSPGFVSSPGAATAARATGTLPFTGSDLRAFALLGNLLMLIGFGLLLLSHRSGRANAFFKKLLPKRLSLTRVG